MRLPAWALTSSCAVLDRVAGTRNALNEPTDDTWEPRPAVPCASYPLSERSLRRADLLGVTVSREVYLEGVDLSPHEHRLRVDGKDYEVVDPREWGPFAVVLVRDV